ncbi:hypothetical protein X798_02909 [Onchocerca flexuosa]|uniref:Tyrosine specific protein phosphatases domain-containing protein n=1 Tax=Onchocerca flexuosa TaxID=387005 RepID=A0A238BXR2_9BILA|nr:hypothetical protein X798_02909 [Onchocerca flexuosa]
MIYQQNVVEIVAVTSLHSAKIFLYIPIKRSDRISVEKRRWSRTKKLHLCLHTWHNKRTSERPIESLPERITCFISNSPIIVHCLTGSERSGALAVLDILCRKMDYIEKLPNGNILSEYQDTIFRIRT